MKCKTKKNNGDKCNANALRDDNYCFSHSEKTRSDKQKAVKKGGKARAIPKTVHKPKMRLERESDILALLKEAINEVRTLPTTTQKATTLGYLSNIMLTTFRQERIFEKMNKKQGEVTPEERAENDRVWGMIG